MEAAGTAVPSDAELSEPVESEDFQKVVDDLYAVLTRELGRRFTLVGGPGPGVARMRIALVAIDHPDDRLDVYVTEGAPTEAGSDEPLPPGLREFGRSAWLEAEMLDSTTNEVVFAVVASSRELARRAARLAKIEVEAQTPIVSVDDALAAESAILPDYTFRKGDSAGALAASVKRVNGRLRIGGQEHFYLEGQIALATPGEDGDMLVQTSTQHPSELQHLIARVLRLPIPVVEKLVAQAVAQSEAALITRLRRCWEVERSLKSSGAAHAEMAVLVAELCNA